jgi:hypothetical protein
LDKEIRVEKRKIKGHEVTIIDNGKYQLAMVSLLGWEKSEVVNTKGLHPESNESSVINLVANAASKDKGLNTYATLMLWKKSGEKWKDKELLPVRSINQTDVGVSIQFNSGKIIRVDFK